MGRVAKRTAFITQPNPDPDLPRFLTPSLRAVYFRAFHGENIVKPRDLPKCNRCKTRDQVTVGYKSYPQSAKQRQPIKIVSQPSVNLRREP